MPVPKPNEKRKDYLSRCMGDKEMLGKFQNPAARYKACIGVFDKEAPSKKASYEIYEVEALQMGRPGPNDPRKTPAKPSERRKGSKKNPPGSAKKPNKNINVSPETRKRLQ